MRHLSSRKLPAARMAAVLALATAAIASSPSQIVNITPEASSAGLIGYNEAGTICGIFGASDGSGGAFLYRNGVRQILSPMTTARCFSQSGYVAGYNYGNGQLTGYLYHDGSLQELGSLGGTWTLPNDVNESGDVVGVSKLAGDVVGHAFLYRNGQILNLGTLLAANSSEAKYINEAGDVAGQFTVAGDLYGHAFLYRNSQMAELPIPPGCFDPVVLGLTESGDVWGGIRESGTGYSQCFLYRHGQMTVFSFGAVATRIVSVTESGLVAGNAGINVYDDYAWVYQNGQVTHLTLGGNLTAIYDGNEGGDVVGLASMPNGTRCGFLYRNGAMRPLSLGGDYALAFQVTEAGDVLGHGTLPGSSEVHCFVYSRFGILTDLGPLPSGIVTGAAKMNEVGDVVAAGYLYGASGIEAHLLHFRNGIWTDLGSTGAPFAQIYGLTDSGHVVARARWSDRNGVQTQLVTASLTPSLMGGLETVIAQYTASGAVDPQVSGSLTAKVDAAMAALERGNTNAAITAMNDLRALINYIEAQTNKKITPEAAADLIARANAIIARLNQ